VRTKSPSRRASQRLSKNRGAELFLALFFTVLDFFFGFRSWCDSYGVLQVCRMVSAQKTDDFPWHLLHFGALVFILHGFCHVLLFVWT